MPSDVIPDPGVGAAQFSVDVRADGGADATVVVRGDLDMVTAPHLSERAAEAASKNLVIDLSQVTFMDSTGLRALWTLRQNVTANGGRAMLRAPSSSVMRVLRTTKLDKVFDYVGDEGDPVVN
jgi:anti-sigma B factor antagonist